MSSDKRATPLYFVPLQSPDMLPEERKKVVRKMHAAIHEAGLHSSNYEHHNEEGTHSKSS